MILSRPREQSLFMATREAVSFNMAIFYSIWWQTEMFGDISWHFLIISLERGRCVKPQTFQCLAKVLWTVPDEALHIVCPSVRLSLCVLYDTSRLQGFITIYTFLLNHHKLLWSIMYSLCQTLLTIMSVHINQVIIVVILKLSRNSWPGG